MRIPCRTIACEAVLLALVGVSAAACGGDDDGDGGADAAPSGGADAGPADGPSLAELGAELAEAICPRLFDCCTNSDLVRLLDDIPGDPPTDVPGCIAALAPPLGEDVAALGRSIDAGRLGYDPGRMKSCLAEFADLSCRDFAGQLDDITTYASCEPPFAAKVDVGGACGVDNECQTSYCANRVDEELGACAALPGEGDSCDFRCAEGLFCDSVGQTCIPQRPDGQSCDEQDQCTSDACVEGVCGPNPICDGEG